jgi:arginyl-tRNA synthetase
MSHKNTTSKGPNMENIKQQIITELEEKLDVEINENDIEVPNAEHGDFAYPVMKAAGQKDRNPRELAESLKEEIDLEPVERIEVAGPGYLNFHLDKGLYAEKIQARLEGSNMGVSQRDGKVKIDFSHPNLAKPMHIGHMRNNCLGDSLQSIMRFVGYDVVSDNYIGDWGTKHGQVIFAFKKWGSMEEFEENPMDHMYELYVKMHDEAGEEDKEKAREWSKKIEEGDEEAVRLWKMFREATIEHNEKEYERMGIEFDRVTGESTVADEAEEVIQEGLDKGIFEKDEDGSVYVEFEDEKYPNTVIQRDDGTTLYLTRDIANLKRLKREGFDQNLYVVANEQDLHFQQLFEIGKKFGIDGMKNEHISYGMVHLHDSSISSSKGNIIRLSDLMDKAVQKAAESSERDVQNSEEIGLGAIKYANLAVSRPKDIEFDWDRVLDFEGESGPYLQYSNVRAKSILEESNKKGEMVGKPQEKEYKLLKKLSRFPEKVENASEQREPAKIANYLTHLSEEFNSFYHTCQVTGVDEETEKRRVKIVELFVKVTDQGLELMGIEPLEEM